MGGLVTISSCKKDDDDPQSKTETISGKNFYIKSMKIDPAVDMMGVPVTDLYSLMPDCTKDDFTKFNDNGTFVSDEGATKCEPSDPQTTNGLWEFLNDETQIKMVSDNETDIYNINELTSSLLKISYSQTDDYGEGEKLYNYTLELEAR